MNSILQKVHKSMNTEFLIDNNCFVCGSENPHGLKLNIIESPDGVKSKIKFPLWTQGYNRIVHGGIVSTVLDEVAVWAGVKKIKSSCVTTELNVRLKKPVKVDEEYVAKGWVKNTKNKLIEAESEIKDRNNNVMASAYVKLLKVT